MQGSRVHQGQRSYYSGTRNSQTSMYCWGSPFFSCFPLLEGVSFTSTAFTGQSRAYDILILWYREAIMNYINVVQTFSRKAASHSACISLELSLAYLIQPLSLSLQEVGFGRNQFLPSLQLSLRPEDLNLQVCAVFAAVHPRSSLSRDLGAFSINVTSLLCKIPRVVSHVHVDWNVKVIFTPPTSA